MSHSRLSYPTLDTSGFGSDRQQQPGMETFEAGKGEGVEHALFQPCIYHISQSSSVVGEAHTPKMPYLGASLPPSPEKDYIKNRRAIEE